MVQIGVIWAALAVVRNPVQRAVIVALAGGALLCSVAGLLWAVWAGYADAQRLPHTLLSDIVMWVVYVVIGLAVAVGVVSALRSQRTRFVWPQGRYQKYRSYRRI
jgi:hypothetical protein